MTEDAPDVTVIEPVLVPVDVYCFTTDCVVPERPSVPLHEYVYEPVPPEGVAVHVMLSLVYPEVGVTAQEVLSGGLETITAVHAPQLFVSLDSLIIPEPVDEFLSAHARMYHVPAEGNAYENVVISDPLAEVFGDVSVPISTVFAPLEDVARWKRLVNSPPVAGLPAFVIVAENVCATLATADVGEIAPAVRSDKTTLTSTELEQLAVVDVEFVLKPPE